MEPGTVWGIVKFFKDEEHLDALLSGHLCCNTPEYYRLHDEQGISDHHESVTHAYRKERDDAKPKLYIGGHAIEGLNRITLRAAGYKDGWLHCWSILKMPDDDVGLAVLVRDIDQLREEFGVHYAYVLPDKVPLFLERLQSATSHRILAREVCYSSDSLEWSPFCKAQPFSYQREFRILVGECSEHSIDHLVIQIPNGLQDIIHKNIGPQLVSEAGDILFQINGSSEHG